LASLIDLHSDSKIKEHFEALFRQLYEPLCRYAMPFLQDPDLCEEAVQNVFVKAWNKRNDVTFSLELKGYLYQAVKNESLNHIKHQNVVLEHVSMVDKNALGHDTNPAILAELETKIQELINLMPPERKRIFLLNRNNGKKYREVAEELNISTKTVENQMGKALKSLRIGLFDYLNVIGLLIIKLLIN
jgi:RNA polymerase sigma-70 factor (ECF subfamily)